MIPLLAVAMTVLLGFTGLAVDVANGYVVRGILQHAVDDAGITARRWSAQVDDAGVDPAAVDAAAVAAALDTAHRDVQAHGLAAVTTVNATVSGSHVRIAARASIPTWLARFFGIASWLPSASSDVALWMPAGSSTAATPPGTAAPPIVSVASGSEGGAGTAGVDQTGAAPGPNAPEPSGPGPEPSAADAPSDPGSSGPSGGEVVEGP